MTAKDVVGRTSLRRVPFVNTRRRDRAKRPPLLLCLFDQTDLVPGVDQPLEVQAPSMGGDRRALVGSFLEAAYVEEVGSDDSVLMGLGLGLTVRYSAVTEASPKKRYLYPHSTRRKTPGCFSFNAATCCSSGVNFAFFVAVAGAASLAAAAAAAGKAHSFRLALRRGVDFVGVAVAFWVLTCNEACVRRISRAANRVSKRSKIIPTLSNYRRRGGILARNSELTFDRLAGRCAASSASLSCATSCFTSAREAASSSWTISHGEHSRALPVTLKVHRVLLYKHCF